MQEEKLYEQIMSKELTWEGLIKDIVKQEGLNPWDLDLTIIINKFIEVLEALEKINFRLSGKFLLAASFLLKMKSDTLIERPAPKNRNIPLNYFGIDLEFFVQEDQLEQMKNESSSLIVRRKVPLPRQRGMTLDDLLSSLGKAIEVRERNVERKKQARERAKREIVKINMIEKITNLYENIADFFTKFKTSTIKFSELVPSNNKKDVIWTFLPLLHLSNDNKVKLLQYEPFDEIYVEKAGGFQGWN